MERQTLYFADPRTDFSLEFFLTTRLGTKWCQYVGQKVNLAIGDTFVGTATIGSASVVNSLHTVDSGLNHAVREQKVHPDDAPRVLKEILEDYYKTSIQPDTLITHLYLVDIEVTYNV